MTRHASDELRRKQDADKKEGDELCAICLSGFDDQNPKFHLDCNHAFHGKCIITSLRYKTWCPTCKDDPKRKDREEEEEEEDNDSDVEHTKQRMLKKLKTETIKSILRDCNEPTHGNRSTLAEEAAMMLTMFSDEESDGEDESDGEENENDEQGDEEQDTLGEWVAGINDYVNAHSGVRRGTGVNRRV